MEVALLVVIRFLNKGEYVMTSNVIKFVDTESARKAGEAIRSHYAAAGFQATTKILEGVA